MINAPLILTETMPKNQRLSRKLSGWLSPTNTAFFVLRKSKTVWFFHCAPIQTTLLFRLVPTPDGMLICAT